MLKSKVLTHAINGASPLQVNRNTGGLLRAGSGLHCMTPATMNK